MSDPNIRVSVDTSESKQKIDAVNNEAARARAQIATNLRRAVTLTQYTLQAVGVVIDEALRIQVQMISTLIETVSLAMAGGTPITLAIKTGQIALLAIQYQKVQQGRSEAAARLGAAEQGLELLAF